MSRAEVIEQKPGEMLVRLKFYPVLDGGPQKQKVLGWGCPMFGHEDRREPGYDCFPKLGTEPMGAGEIREVELVFLSGKKAVRYFENFSKLYLWEGRIIGEAKILDILI